MIVVPYKAEHLLSMRIQVGQAKYSPWITDEYARSLESQYAFTALVDGRPVLVGGLYEMWENRALLWSLLDSTAGSHFISLHRSVKRFLDMQPYRRIEAECDCDFAPGHRWLKLLGFRLEAARMRAFRVDGGDSSLYAKVK
jgi:RimJ/RimL family protein N-acetyltransferase